MVLGLYYLTRMRGRCEGRRQDLRVGRGCPQALDHGLIDKHAKIKVRVDGEMHRDHGRPLHLQRDPPRGLALRERGARARSQNKRLIGEIHEQLGVTACMTFLDALKNLGFEAATTAGLTIGIEDVLIPDAKNDVIDEAQARGSPRSARSTRRARSANSERYNRVIDRWTSVSDQVADDMFEELQAGSSGLQPGLHDARLRRARQS